MLGNGLSGVSTNILQTICLLSFPDDLYKGALIYFILSACILVACAIGAIVLSKNSCFNYYFDKANAKQSQSVRRISGIYDEKDLLMEGEGDINNTSHLTPAKASTESFKQQESTQKHSSFMAFLILLKKAFFVAYPFYLSLMFCFTITFIVFPGVSCDILLNFLDGAKNYESWLFVIMITLFNVFDTIGRFMGGHPKFQLSDNQTFILSYSRTIFFITFMLIAYGTPPSWLFGDNSDWFKIINMILFSITNGFASTLCAVKSPSRAPSDMKESVGMFISIFLTMGILLGSVIAIGIGKVVPT